MVTNASTTHLVPRWTGCLWTLPQSCPLGCLPSPVPSKREMLVQLPIAFYSMAGSVKARYFAGTRELSMVAIKSADILQNIFPGDPFPTFVQIVEYFSLRSVLALLHSMKELKLVSSLKQRFNGVRHMYSSRRMGMRTGEP